MNSLGDGRSSAPKGRFLIIDQSLRSFQGHHFEYDVSVAEAAARAGWEPIIFAHKSLSREVEPSSVRVCRLFTATDQPGRGILRSGPTSWLPVTIAGRLLHVVSAMGWLRVRDADPSFAEELADLLGCRSLRKNDVVLLHTLHIWQLERVLSLLEALPKINLPSFHIVLRRDIGEALGANASGMGLKTCLGRFCASGLYPRHVHFYTDTERLTAQYDAVSAIRFKTLPIPFRHELIDRAAATTKGQDDFVKHVVYLGDARPEKGYLHLPGLVAGLWQDYAQTGKVKFTIQSNFNVPGGERGALDARRRLAQFPDDVVTLITEPLQPKDYYRLLADADIVVLPYDADRYAARSSGVLSEALSAGKVVVAPSGTWMADQLDWARGRTFTDPLSLSAAVASAVDHFDALSTAATVYARRWRHKHSPEVLMSILCKDHRTMRWKEDPFIQSTDLRDERDTQFAQR